MGAGAVSWARITFRTGTSEDMAETEIEVGTDEAGYPDVLSEIVAQVSKLHRLTVGGESPTPDVQVGE